MAKFGERRFTFTEIQKFYRIPISSSGDQCFLNTGKSSIVKIHNEKTLHTWTLTHPNYFTSPVVYFDETLYCIMNNNILIKWSINEDNLKNAEKVKFQDSVFAVIPVIGEQPLVLFSNAKYALIDGCDISNLKPIGCRCLNENEELLWADISAVASDIKVFCLAYNKKDKVYTIHSFIVKKNEKTSVDLHSHGISHQTTDLRNWCLNSHDSSIVTVWSDGMIYHHKDSKHTNILFLKDTESNMPIAITCIDSTHIAVAMAGINQKECILEIWDSKFSVLKARKVLKTSLLDNLQIAADNSSIFLCLNKEVISIPFHVESSTVAAATGKSISETSKAFVFSWDKGQLQQIPSSDEPEAMDVPELKQDLNSVEIIAQRLLNQNSKYLMHIPESELTKLLQLAVKYSKEENASEKCSRNAACVILNVVFSASFNDIFLVKHLKRMNLEETLVSLELLLSFLNYTIEMPAGVVQKPSDLQIVNWTCLIIQSHMEALLFSKDKKSQKLLRKLEKAVLMKMDEYDDYEDIQNYFIILQKKNLLPEKSSVGKYSIETLDI